MDRGKVLCSVINWKRAGNMPAVLRRLREQSVPVHLALVECSPNTAFACPPEAAALADTVFTVNTNCGPASRFIPPLMLPQFRYTYFGVDDHLPGRRHIECLLRCADSFEGRYATIGQDGRRIREGGEYVKRRWRPHPRAPRAVDVVTSSELTETCRIPAAAEFMSRVANEFDDPSLVSEDDFILCMALQMSMRHWFDSSCCPCYITPQCEPDEWWAEKRLPDSFALSARPDHKERRDRFIQKAMEVVGWTPQACLAGPDPWELDLARERVSGSTGEEASEEESCPSQF